MILGSDERSKHPVIGARRIMRRIKPFLRWMNGRTGHTMIQQIAGNVQHFLSQSVQSGRRGG
jgi:hypothetical protein